MSRPPDPNLTTLPQSEDTLPSPPVIRALLQHLGFEELEPDEQGVFTFYVDDELPVYLRPGTDGGLLVLHAGIGALGDADPVSVLPVLLKGNVVEMDREGFALGLVPETDLVILIGRQPLEGLDVERLAQLFDSFLAAAASWRDLFQALVAASPREASAANAVVPPENLGPGAFV